ncbi:MAG TPA: DinB family protein [Armatimonadota bacterium]|jgi:uncharacterized damage-inducible protein DinB
MPYTVADALEQTRAARQHFLKHLAGLTDEQWDWKPYAECNSIRQTIAHLIVDDRAGLDTLKSGEFPDYESFKPAETETDALLARLEESHCALTGYIGSQLADTPLETEIRFHGETMKLGAALGLLNTEDYYHAGQVAFIRLATDPKWDYYAAIYG